MGCHPSSNIAESVKPIKNLQREAKILALNINIYPE